MSSVGRCPACQARVHVDHLVTHRKYNCQLGLHQPPVGPEEPSFVCCWHEEGQSGWQKINVVIPERNSGEHDKDYWPRMVEYLRLAIPLPLSATTIIRP